MKKEIDLTKETKKLMKPEKTISEIYFSYGTSHLSCDNEYGFENQSPAKTSDWGKSHKSFSVHAYEWYYEIVFSVAADEWDFETDMTVRDSKSIKHQRSFY